MIPSFNISLILGRLSNCEFQHKKEHKLIDIINKHSYIILNFDIYKKTALMNPINIPLLIVLPTNLGGPYL